MTPKQNLAAAIERSLRDAYDNGRADGIFEIIGTVRADEATYTAVIEMANEENIDYTLGKRNALRDVVREWSR